MFRLRRQVYLDNNATTPVLASVRKRVSRVLESNFGNPSSLYKAARDSALVLDEARQEVSRTIGAESGEILFTGSATEANNTALISAFEVCGHEKRKIVSSPIEHASVLETLDYLTGHGAEVEFCPVDEFGLVRLDALRDIIDEHTLLVCVMLANNEIGTIQAIPDITRMAHSRGSLMMSDCVQALGKIDVDLERLGVDYASFSAHKIHGPKGVGCLFVRSGSPLTPFIHGGHQEFGHRAGTESLHNIAGFATACAHVPKFLAEADSVRRRAGELRAALESIQPEVRWHSRPGEGLPNTLSATFPGVNNAAFMAALDFEGVSVSAGSACDTQEDTPSHVLRAIGLTPAEARETLRISLSTDTSDKDVRYAQGIFESYLLGRSDRVSMITPAQLDERILFDEQTYVLDVRWWHDRQMLKGLPNSHEVPFLKAKKYFHRIPRDKNILVVCQVGPNSPFVAYQLKAMRFNTVSFLLTGLVGWKMAHPDLYKKYAGDNTTVLER